MGDFEGLEIKEAWLAALSLSQPQYIPTCEWTFQCLVPGGTCKTEALMLSCLTLAELLLCGLSLSIYGIGLEEHVPTFF